MKSQVPAWFLITPPSAAPTVSYHWNVQTQRADVLFQCHHWDNQMSFLRCVWCDHGYLNIGVEKRYEGIIVEESKECVLKSTNSNEVLDHDRETKMTTDALRWTLLGKTGQSRKRASNSCWLKRHQASHLFSAERPLKRFFPADTFAALAPPVSLLSGLENPG